MNSNPHHCHAEGCTRSVPARLLMCPSHWRMVPADLAARVWETYRPGQERTKDPSAEYLDAAQAAITAVAAGEGRRRSSLRRPSTTVVGDDGRVVYGARCSWWGFIGEVGSTASGLPACPHCAGVLLEVENGTTWWAGVDQHEASGNAHYREFIEWLRGQHFSNLTIARQYFDGERSMRSGPSKDPS